VSRVLLVSNGHGEVAIADRIATELRALVPRADVEHLGLVGDISTRAARDVGPRRRMPSGGLIAMGNAANLLRDLRSGLLRLTLEQWRFLSDARGRYDAVVAVGDVFALFMALRASAPTVYVGTAKSVWVAPYGRFEERVMRRARAIFVRDEPTAERLRAHGIDAQAGNTIVDFSADRSSALPSGALDGFTSVVALLPGSRRHAYDDAAFLTSIFADAARERPGLGALLSIAPGIDAGRLRNALHDAGFEVRALPLDQVPFEVARGARVLARAWSGDVGPALGAVQLVLGQAGTANEAAAAAGLPVIAFDRGVDREHAWYRKRQSKLLGEALVAASGDRESAVRSVCALLDDSQRRARLGAIGRGRMGSPGASTRIARRVAEMIASGSTE
jgi:uncharacterized protein (TIGR03492 family)